MRSNGRDHLAMVVVEAVELVEVEKRRKPARRRTKEDGSLVEKGKKNRDLEGKFSRVAME